MKDHTALVVVVPEAEPVVDRWRQQHDASAVLGMPAHITVLFPLGGFAAVRDRVAELCATHQPFTCALARVATFDRDVIWLQPETDEPFRALTSTAMAAFPESPPYAGTITDPTPHLTVAQPSDALFDDLLAKARADIEPNLPLTFDVSAATLFGMTDDGRYLELERFPFAAAG